MKEISGSTKKFIDFLEGKINSGSGVALKFKIISIMLNHAENDRDRKLILMKHITDDQVKNKLCKYMNDNHPHLLDMVEKLLILI